MATQQLFDAYSSTLSAPYTSGGSSLSVTAVTLPEGGNLPTSGNYTVTVTDASSGAVKAIFTVTSRSGTTLTTSAQLDANCSSGDVITGFTLSKSSMLGIGADWLGYGTYASLPASGQFIGQRYRCSDTSYEFLWDGAKWVAFAAGYFQPLIVPPSAGWTAGASYTVNGDYSLGFGRIVVAGATLFAYDYRTSPVTPWTLDAIVEADSFNNAGGSTSGGGMIACRDGSGKLVTFGCGYDGSGLGFISCSKWNSGGSFSANYSASNPLFNRARMVPLRITNDATNLTFYAAWDGFNFVQFDQHAVGDFLGTITGLAWGGFVNNSSSVHQRLLHWNVT